MASRSDSGRGSASQAQVTVPELDDLLEELRERAEAAHRGNQQIEALLDAVLAISADWELPTMLQRIVDAACSLVNAQYGALGVLGPDPTQLVQFITHGLTQQERDAIGELPRGEGVLGLLIREPLPVRISDIAEHPDSFGFPPHHPPMKSFLGAPIRIRGNVYGNLYLTEKRGATEFSVEDEAMVAALAAAAGVALQNARLYEDIRMRREWSLATNDVTQSLLARGDEAMSLHVLAERVCAVVGAEACMVAVNREGLSPLITAMHTVGAEIATPTLGVLGDAWSSALATERTLLLLPDTSTKHPQAIIEEVQHAVGLSEPGPTALVPVTAGPRLVGVIIPVWASSQTDVANRSVDALAEFGKQVGIALVAGRAQSDRATVLLLEDRERIARDMHDLVIQRLFATGLSLQFAQPLAQHPVVRSRLDEAVTELDHAITDIREVINQLHAMSQPVGVAQKVADLVENYSQTLGFAVQLHTTDSGELEPGLEMDVLAVVREGLANVVRHSRASAAAVTLALGPEVRVQIDDDGVGIDETARRSGLANLADRAAARSGQCEITHREPSGTRIDWRVPTSGSTEDHTADSGAGGF
ncbi:MAG: GAF domain-containing protein [Ornithinimicrobium sp.]